MAMSVSTYTRHIWHIWYIWSVWYVANVRSWRAPGKGFAAGRASSSKEGRRGRAGTPINFLFRMGYGGVAGVWRELGNDLAPCSYKP